MHKIIKLELIIDKVTDTEAEGVFISTVNIHAVAIETFIRHNLILTGFMDCEADDFEVTAAFNGNQHIIDGLTMVSGRWHAFVRARV
jgi:hypothetical protein